MCHMHGNFRRLKLFVVISWNYFHGLWSTHKVEFNRGVSMYNIMVVKKLYYKLVAMSYPGVYTICISKNF